MLFLIEYKHPPGGFLVLGLVDATSAAAAVHEGRRQFPGYHNIDARHINGAVRDELFDKGILFCDGGPGCCSHGSDKPHLHRLQHE